MTTHATGRLLSHQARRQLKLACLAAATHSVLMRETGGDAAAVEEHIAQSMGRWGLGRTHCAPRRSLLPHQTIAPPRPGADGSRPPEACRHTRLSPSRASPTLPPPPFPP
jgi:hypothetical protein